MQVRFLGEMVREANRHGMRAALFQPPIHEALRKYYEPIVGRYRAIAERELAGAPLLDHATVEVPDRGFGDLLHLNRYGADIYSRFLRESGLEALGYRRIGGEPGGMR